MPNQNNTQKPKAKETQNNPTVYDAGDLWDAHSLAEADLNWCSTAITDLRNRINEIKKVFIACNQGYGIHFEQTQTLLDMYEYLIDNRLNHHKKEAQAYRAEYEKDKAVTL